MEKTTCQNCTHYRQHYTLRGGRITRIHCGHCTFSRRPKAKKPDAAACEHHVPAPPDEDAFVDKKYLTRKLLQYIFDMELLPAIND